MRITKQLIKDFAKLCNIAYCNQEQVNEGFTNKPHNVNDSVFYRCNKEPLLYSCERDSQMYVSEYKNDLAIIFRGTESGRDILTDLNAIRVDMDAPYLKATETPQIHWGFYNQFNELKINLDKIVESYVNEKENNLNEPAPNIIFSGHSLGGALATIASTYYGLKYPNTFITCITFGSPRVGDQKFANLFDNTVSNSIRVVNDNDPIPCIPTAWRFRHVKGCLWLYQDQVTNEITAWRGWRFFKNYFLSFVGYGYDASQDHSCIGYVKDSDFIPEGYFNNDESFININEKFENNKDK